MTCTSCGDKPKNSAKGFPRAVVEINNPESLVLLRKVVIPVSMGTEEDVPPAIGKYFNVLLQYEANGHIYLYSSDGIPTAIEANIPQEVLDRIEDLEIEDTRLHNEIAEVASDLADETTAREAADSALSSSIESLSSSLSAETEARELADAALEGSINNLTVDLEEEAGAREAADAALGGRIDTVAGNLATETANRISADEGLQANITAEATARANADTALGTRIDGVAADLAAETSARTAADTALGNRVTAIEEKIPTQASAQNQLADKDFVNSSVATNTANYISDNGQPFTSLAALEAYSGTLTNNDYAFVVGTDQAGNTTYTRYKYVASTSSWAEEYVLNNSSFTANQWAAINSGITSGDVSKLAGLANIQTIGANLSLTNGELSATDTTYTAGSNVQISAQNVISATDTTYTAGTGLDLTGTQFSIDNTVALKSEIPTKTSDLTNDSDFVTNTDYATTSTGGVIKTSTNYGNQLTSNGVLAGASKTYAAYQSSPDTMLVSKNCLENVIDGKGLVDQTDLATKQDTLTAGSNIQINNNVISATDTTYSNFTGATSSTAGTNGLVPAPAAGDEGKFLSGNGQWTTVSQYALPIASATDLGGIKVGANLTIDSTTGVLSADAQQITPVQTTGTSTADIMSQDAVTKMIYPYYQNQNKGIIAIGTNANALYRSSIALGPYSTTSAVGEMNIGSTNTQYGYNNSNYRLLTGLYDPQNDHDAATKGYVDTSITTAISGITGVQFEVVQTLPATGDAGTIYLVPNSGTTPNIYDEYIYVNNSFEKIGTTEIDLSNYVTNTQLNTTLAAYATTASLATVATTGDYEDLINTPAVFTSVEWDALWA